MCVSACLLVCVFAGFYFSITEANASKFGDERTISFGKIRLTKIYSKIPLYKNDTIVDMHGCSKKLEHARCIAYILRFVRNS